MTTKAARRARNRAEKLAKEAAQWKSERDKERPTTERLFKGGMRAKGSELGLGTWNLTENDGGYAARDYGAHPIDKLEHSGVISKEQGQAGRDFEALNRAAKEIGGIRDSCTIWEPKGYESDDGPVEAKPKLRELERRLAADQLAELRRVCVEQDPPRLNPRDLGALREGLNECERFFRRMR